MLLVSCVLPGGCGGEGGPTQQANTPREEAARTPEEVEGVTADQVLQRMVKAYREAEAYFDNAENWQQFVPRDQGVVIKPPPHQISIAFRRPNQLRITRHAPAPEGRPLDLTFASDGDRLRLATSDMPDRMLDLPAPDEISLEVLSKVNQESGGMLIPVPLKFIYPQLDLLLSTEESPPRLLSEARGKAKLLPSKSIGDTPCYRVQLVHQLGPCVAWIDKQTSLLKRLDTSNEETKRQLDPENALTQLDLWIDLRDATTQTLIGVQTFRLQPTGDTQLVDSFRVPAASEEAQDKKDDQTDERNSGTDPAANPAANPTDNNTDNNTDSNTDATQDDAS